MFTSIIAVTLGVLDELFFTWHCYKLRREAREVADIFVECMYKELNRKKDDHERRVLYRLEL